MLEWSFARREKVLFFPDQHLGRWSGYMMDIPLDEMVVWDPDEPLGGLSAGADPQSQDPAVEGALLSAPDVPGPARPALAATASGRDGDLPSGGSFEVCKLSDYVGSTEYIIKTIADAQPNTRWLVGTELNLVNRIAEEFKPQGKIVQFMAPTVCMCSTMARIDPQHLAWCWRTWSRARS